MITFRRELVAAEVRVVHLAEQLRLRRAFRELRQPGCGDIREDHLLGIGELADQGGALGEDIA
jgi:hypothetical protein